MRLQIFVTLVVTAVPAVFPVHAQAPGMWNKPSEITGGLYSAYGYEIAVAGGIITPFP